MNTSIATGFTPELLKEVEEVLEQETATPKPRRTKVEDKPLQRLIAESSLYDWNPTARLILNQLAALRMDENSRYPKDAPTHYPDGRPWEKIDWCWMAQWELSLRCGLDSKGRTFRWWIERFREDGTVLVRKWEDDNGTKHTEYKVVGEAFMAFQRPENRDAALASRPPYYKRERGANKGSFSTANQPGREPKRRAIMEQDEE
jgi:hypothetical protein